MSETNRLMIPSFEVRVTIRCAIPRRNLKVQAWSIHADRVDPIHQNFGLNVHYEKCTCMSLITTVRITIPNKVHERGLSYDKMTR